MGCCITLCRDRFDAVPKLEQLPRFEEDWETVVDSLQTGDIYLEHNTNDFAKMTHLTHSSEWDHVGMIIKIEWEHVAPRIAKMAEDGKFMKLPPFYSGSGVPPGLKKSFVWSPPREGQIQRCEALGVGTYSYPMKESAIAHGDKSQYLAIRRLNKPLSTDQKHIIEETVLKFWARLYERTAKEIITPMFHNPSIDDASVNKNKETLDQLFCSELVAELYQVAGLLPERNLNSNSILPYMFDKDKAIDGLLLDNYSLGNVTVLKRPGDAFTHWVENERQRRFNASKQSKNEK